MNAQTMQPGGLAEWRWAPAWVLTFVALWPARGIAEAVLVLGALAGLVRLVGSRFRGGGALLSGPAGSILAASGSVAAARVVRGMTLTESKIAVTGVLAPEETARPAWRAAGNLPQAAPTICQLTPFVER